MTETDILKEAIGYYDRINTSGADSREMTITKAYLRFGRAAEKLFERLPEAAMLGAELRIEFAAYKKATESIEKRP